VTSAQATRKAASRARALELLAKSDYRVIAGGWQYGTVGAERGPTIHRATMNMLWRLGRVRSTEPDHSWAKGVLSLRECDHYTRAVIDPKTGVCNGCGEVPCAS